MARRVSDEDAAKIAKSVCCVVTDGGVGSGSLVDWKGRVWLYTCHHCLPNEEAARGATFFLGDYDEGIDPADQDGGTLDPAAGYFADETLDYALVACETEPKTKELIDNATVSALQRPQGTPCRGRPI